ncbi:MAG: hypothetical protein WBG94_05565 [Anaerolineales bacterium]
MTARLAGGVNLNYFRLDSPDHHQTTAGDHLLCAVTARWVNGNAQGEFEAPTNVSDGFPLSAGKNLTAAHQSSLVHSPLMVVHFSLKPDNYPARQFL